MTMIDTNKLNDQELLGLIAQESDKVGQGNENQMIVALKREFLRRRDSEHPGVSEISIHNYSGRAINLFALFDSDFDNIGEQLSVTLPRICRFWGQTKIFYSVAQHCLSMVEHFNGDGELQKYAILHEVFEGFSFDCATPIKRMLPAYKSAEDRALETAARTHGLKWPFPDIIKTVDKGLMVMEGEALNRAEASMGEIKADFFNMYEKMFL